MAAPSHSHDSSTTVRANPLIRARVTTPPLDPDTGPSPVVRAGSVHSGGASQSSRAPSPGANRKPPKFPRSRAETGDSTDDDERALVINAGGAGHKRVASSNSLASDGASVDTLHSGQVGGGTGGGSRLVPVANGGSGGSGGSPGPGPVPCGPIPLVSTKDVDLVAVCDKYGPRLRPGGCSTAHVTGPGCFTGINPGALSRFLQHRVSRAKRRFVEDGYDLDLTYVTDRIIAMGFPAVGAEQLYRNPRHVVARLFHTRHPGHHKVYNLCSEPGRRYPSTVFHASACCPFPDHGVPSLQLMYWACEDMARFLSRDPENVVAIHCKAGKGRSGLIICMLLLRIGMFTDAKQAIAFYNQQRTHDGNGVRVPSQRTYTRYYQQLLDRVRTSSPASALNEPLRMLHLLSLHNVSQKRPRLQLLVFAPSREGNELLFQSPPACTHFECGGVALRGNVLIQIKTLGCRPRKLISFWFNTAFVDPSLEIVRKRAIDSLRTDKKHRKQPQDFEVRLQFTDTASAASAFPTRLSTTAASRGASARAQSSKDAAASFGRASGSGASVAAAGRRSRGSTSSSSGSKRGPTRATRAGKAVAAQPAQPLPHD